VSWLERTTFATAGNETGRFGSARVFALIIIFVFLLHLPLLWLPYFWDEAGYYIPAARDLFLSGSVIPHSTPSNAHPPLVMAYLALAWKIAGYSPLVTRSAMLLVAGFTLFTLFQLAQRVANREVAVAAVICTGVYPVFFTQSSLAHVDLAAAGLIFAGLESYFEDRLRAAGLWLSLAALAKETAILAPLALILWELVCSTRAGVSALQALSVDQAKHERRRWRAASLLLPLLTLFLWYGYHYAQTGYVFGNPDFFRYNVEATLNPVRILLALTMRLWQVLGYMQLALLVLAMLLAMWLPPLQDDAGERPRIHLPVQVVLLLIVTFDVIAMAFVGGAVLARYLLPAVPLVIVVSISTLWRRVRYWKAVLAVVVFGFVMALFVNPPYGFSIEDNLAYRDYILLHKDAEEFLLRRYPAARVLTAWPASDEISRPYLGYVNRPMRVFRIENFNLEQVMSAAEVRSDFDVALVFSTKYEPPHPLLEHWRIWQELQARFFGFHRDLPAAVAAQILGGEIVFSETRHQQWVAVIAWQRIEEAKYAAGPQLLPKQMTGMGLYHEPDLTSGGELQSVAGGQREMNFHVDATLNHRDDDHVAAGERSDFAYNNVAGT
jgi:hypothetical protein